MKILAIIPARSGSKGIPNKNIRLINNKPMLSYSIEHALNSKYINRVILSTDSPDYAEIGKNYGAEIPFLRPAEYATDTALDIDVFFHALTFLKEHENYFADIVVHLRPTYPIRNPDDIDAMIDILLEDNDIDSVRSISCAKENPFKMWTMDKAGKLYPISSQIHECYNLPRQQLPTPYYQNACIDVVRGDVIISQKSMTGNNIYGYLMTDNFDIDTEEDFKVASQYLQVTKGKSIFCVDIDGVIAITNDTSDYSKSIPNIDIIRKINKFYDFGNKIILYTARGYLSGVDWMDLTKRQMNDWEVKYNELRMGKPAADFYIDDHAMTLAGLDNLFEIINNKEF